MTILLWKVPCFDNLQMTYRENYRKLRSYGHSGVKAI